MSSTERTLSKVSDEFMEELSSEVSKEEQELLETLEREKKEIQELISRIAENAVKQAESLKRQIVGSAEIEARNNQLRVIEDGVIDVIHSALDRIEKLDRERYRAALSRMLAEAYETIGRECIVYCNERDHKLISSIIKKLERVSLSAENIKSVGGIIVESKDKTTRFDNTLEARVERMRQELRKEITSLLTSD